MTIGTESPWWVLVKELFFNAGYGVSIPSRDSHSRAWDDGEPEIGGNVAKGNFEKEERKNAR